MFTHISQFPRELRRPMATDLVAYTVGRDDRNRLVAQGVTFLAPAHARHEESRPLHVAGLAIPGAFTVIVLALTATQTIPPTVIAFYAVTSLVAFAMYWQDKVAATRGQWRTSESALLGIALIGGWPGAYLARHTFRHKTHKQPFRTYFWLAVGANCACLALIMAAMSQTPG